MLHILVLQSDLDYDLIERLEVIFSENFFFFISSIKVVVESLIFILIFGACTLKDWMVGWFIYIVLFYKIENQSLE